MYSSRNIMLASAIQNMNKIRFPLITYPFLCLRKKTCDVLIIVVHYRFTTGIKSSYLLSIISLYVVSIVAFVATSQTMRLAVIYVEEILWLVK